MYQLISRLSIVQFLLFTTMLLNIGISKSNAQTKPGTVNRPCFKQENILNMPSDPLKLAEIDGLLLMREEEKLARDVYIVLYQNQGHCLFNNISRSEQRHTSVVKTLLEKYQISDPVKGDSIGVFKNPTLQKLFEELTARGKTSLKEALKVGALIEEIDILDLQKKLQGIKGNDDIRFVYNHLMRGSRNHLRAFVRNLRRIGIHYTPVRLSTVQFNTVMETTRETGRN